MTLASTLIDGVKARPATMEKLRRTLKLPKGAPLNLKVFETVLDGKTFYTCWTDGKEGERWSPLGYATFEALEILPLGTNRLVMQMLDLDNYPPEVVESTIAGALVKASEGMKMCFMGGRKGELDALMPKALNVSPGSIQLYH